MAVTTTQYRVTLHRLHKFFTKVQITNGCWTWLGATSSNGYGVFEGTSAYRYTYTWMVKPIPVGLTIDHLCLNPLCVNPAHLEAVTHQENIQRANKTRLHPFSDFAEHIGVKPAALRRIMAGECRLPRLPIAVQIHNATGITLRQMAEGQLATLLTKHFAKFKDTQAQQTTGYFDIPNSSSQVIDEGSEARHDV